MNPLHFQSLVVVLVPGGRNLVSVKQSLTSPFLKGDERGILDLNVWKSPLPPFVKGGSTRA